MMKHLYQRHPNSNISYKFIFENKINCVYLVVTNTYLLLRKTTKVSILTIRTLKLKNSEVPCILGY